MAKLTKAQLEAELQSLATKYKTLIAQHNVLRTKYDELRATHDAHKAGHIPNAKAAIAKLRVMFPDRKSFTKAEVQSVLPL